MESLLEDVDEYADGGMDVYAMKKNSHSAAEKYYDNMRVCFALWKCVCVCVSVCLRFVQKGRLRCIRIHYRALLTCLRTCMCCLVRTLVCVYVSWYWRPAETR